MCLFVECQSFDCSIVVDKEEIVMKMIACVVVSEFDSHE